jgi:phage-related protein
MAEGILNTDYEIKVTMDNNTSSVYRVDEFIEQHKADLKFYEDYE